MGICINYECKTDTAEKIELAVDFIENICKVFHIPTVRIAESGYSGLTKFYNNGTVGLQYIDFEYKKQKGWKKSQRVGILASLPSSDLSEPFAFTYFTHNGTIYVDGFYRTMTGKDDTESICRHVESDKLVANPCNSNAGDLPDWRLRLAFGRTER